MRLAQRKAHNALNGQTLTEVWQARGEILLASQILFDRSRHLPDPTNHPDLRISGMMGKIANAAWAKAVAREFGPACTITYNNGDCTLGCGEVYIRYDGVPR